MGDTKTRITVKIELVGDARRIEQDLGNGHKRVKIEQDQIKVQVFYSKGGINYGTYEQEPRGYWLSVSPVMVERTEGEQFGFEHYMGFSGVKKFVKEATRFNAKTLDEVAKQAAESTELVDAMKARILAKETATA